MIITQTLPKGVSRMKFYEGVWVVDCDTYTDLAVALRHHLLALSHLKSSIEAKGEKMGLLYDYFTGNIFRQRVEAMVGLFITMREDLEREKRSISKSWSARDMQIKQVEGVVSGLYGDLQGMMGKNLLAIEALELP